MGAGKLGYVVLGDLGFVGLHPATVRTPVTPDQPEEQEDPNPLLLVKIWLHRWAEWLVSTYIGI